MKEEDIDKRIERVVKSVGSKKAAMAQWESDRTASEMQRKVAAKRWRTFGISAAASIIVICGVCLGFYMNRGGDDYIGASTAPIYRGSQCNLSEIQAMIDSTQYDKALQAIEEAMADTVIDPSFTAERQDYLRSTNANRDYELTWLKIDALVKSKKINEAISLLETYSAIEGAHQDAAIILLHTLTK